MKFCSFDPLRQDWDEARDVTGRGTNWMLTIILVRFFFQVGFPFCSYFFHVITGLVIVECSS